MLLSALPSLGKRDSSRLAAVYAGTVSATLRALTFFLPCGVSYVSLCEEGEWGQLGFGRVDRHEPAHDNKVLR